MKPLTDSEKIDQIHKRLALLQIFQGTVALITILGFIGIFSFSDLKKKL